MSRDELLMERVAKRDKQALSALYDRYHRMVWNFASRSHVDPNACEELVSRVFSHLWLQPGDFRSDRNFAALLLECCRSKSLEMREKKCC
ncbi:RNA polymerase sigma factor [Planococcus sp. FY231025]|uniref:RNA polymerase sigma factor n=1 Tax=Planococcus sp. FY231025 TaxID=3455699 RepID=UPI003F9287A4